MAPLPVAKCAVRTRKVSASSPSLSRISIAASTILSFERASARRRVRGLGFMICRLLLLECCSSLIRLEHVLVIEALDRACQSKSVAWVCDNALDLDDPAQAAARWF